MDEQNIDILERKLRTTAMMWRGAHNKKNADSFVQEYHATMAELWLLQWDPDLDPDEELPDELMPQYYIEYWKQYRALKRSIAEIAKEWHKAESQNNSHLSNQILNQYHTILNQFWQLLRCKEFLPYSSELPDELMPAYYREFSKQRERKNL